MAKVDLPALEAQARSAEKVAQERAAAYDHAIEALTAFINDDSLKGAAYDKAKAYAEYRSIPYLRGAKLFVEETAVACRKLVNKYYSEVGNESLDEDVLEAQVAAYTGVAQANQKQYELLEVAEGIAASTLGALSTAIETAQAYAKEAQEKLDKLRAFFATSSSVLEGLDELQAAVTQAATQVGQNYTRFEGEFPDVRGVAQPDWVKTINKYLEEQKKAAKLKKVERQMDGKQAPAIDTKGLSKAFLKKVDKMSLAELEKNYGGTIRAREQFRGTGYGRVVLNAKDLREKTYILARYDQLKAIENAKKQATFPENSPYYYKNLFQIIKETGMHPSGRPATEGEIWIAKSGIVPVISFTTEGLQLASNIYFAKQAYSQYYGATKVEFGGTAKAPISSYSREQNEMRTRFQMAVDNGKIKTELNIQSQNKHIQGTYEYEQYVNNNNLKGRPEPSYLTISSEEAEQLIQRYSGTGKFKYILDKGKIPNKEIITQEKIIGIYIDKITGEQIPTSSFRIHYSKTGTHIVPTIKGGQ